MGGISAEMLKARGRTVIQWMCGICNQIWESDVVPEEVLEEGIILCICKKGDLSNCNNWRRVTLLSTPEKVYCQMILNCMHNVVDAQLQEEQVGFRPKQSCAEQIFTLWHIIEK